MYTQHNTTQHNSRNSIVSLFGTTTTRATSKSNSNSNSNSNRNIKRKTMELKEEIRMWKRGKILGKGGFGSVFLATTNSGVSTSTLPPLMAVKSVEITQGNVSPATSLLEERYILSHLPPSPHIIGFYGEQVTLDQGQFYFNLLLEYACLGSLGDRIRETTSGLPEPEVHHYTRPILQGLQHIHQHKFVHCDFKPDNILLVFDSSSPPLPTPKIADFGLAKFAGEQVDVQDTTHHLRGTPFYMAPESIRYSQFEPPCDVWSLGCVVLEMLTAKSVWDCNKNPSLRHLLRRIAYTDELPVIPTTISTQAQDFLRKCLVKDTSLRWTPEMLLQHPFLLPPLSQVLHLHNLSERIDYISGDDIGNGCFTSPTCSDTLFACNSFIPLKVEGKIEVSSKGGKRRKTPHEVHEVTDRPPYVFADTTYKYNGPWTTEPHPFINAILV